MNEIQLDSLTRTMRAYILECTSRAGSGHPTSSLSAVELMAGLVFGGTFRFDPSHRDHPNNDRLIFSKGHATPLLYALWLAAGQLTEDQIMTYRQFKSPLEGHPTPRFRFTAAETGSLGQGLAIGVGMAINAKYLDKLPHRTYVLLGDSGMAEGSQWESLQLAAHYELNNLVGVLDVNRLGQRGQTMYGWNTEAYQQRIEAFGWATLSIDGHDLAEVCNAFRRAEAATRPTMIIARTIKGKGVSFLENENGWHGKALDDEQLKRACEELGEVDKSIRGSVRPPEDLHSAVLTSQPAAPCAHQKGDALATRDAYGLGLRRLYPAFPRIVALDGEVSNSTRAAKFRDAYPERFFEMFIAEQNMVGTALGMALQGKLPFVSTFAAFLTRAFDQIRMCQYSRPNLKFIGSHAGVSVGQDGPSQMGLEDLAMFRSLIHSVVLYPCDAVSGEKLVEAAATYEGIVYLRMTRMKTPVNYDVDEPFPIGGCKVLRRTGEDVATVVAAGVTVHEALAAHDALQNEGIAIRVIDLYSIRPLDQETLRTAARETGTMITVEDHNPSGGLGEAVATALSPQGLAVHGLAVQKIPMSGKPAELLDYENISRRAIADKVKALTTEKAKPLT